MLELSGRLACALSRCGRWDRFSHECGRRGVWEPLCVCGCGAFFLGLCCLPLCLSNCDGDAMSSGNAKRSASDEDQESCSEASAPPSMTITSDEINFLIHRYLRESGKLATRRLVVNLRETSIFCVVVVCGCVVCFCTS